jgi:lipid-binding SYLF domain-containing protein
MNLFTLLSVVTLAWSVSAVPVKRMERRVRTSTQVFNDRMSGPDYIPKLILDSAQCIASVRNIKAGLILGGESSAGLVSCRVNGQWSAPSFFTMGGAKLGLLIGGQVSDNVLVFLSDTARSRLDKASFYLGTDLSFAVGPVGSGGGGSILPRVDILVYSAGKGLYAGFSIDGTIMSHQNTWNGEVYGSGSSSATVLKTEGTKAPVLVKPYIDALGHYAP